MKASLDWIKQLLPSLEADAASVEARLTAAGLEVESVSREADAFAEVVVAEVKAVAPHPDAKKLSVTEVFDGTAVHTVVCGAPNVAAGQRVALARIGAKLPNGLEIVERTIRGVTSRGMLCAADELGLAETAQAERIASQRRAEVGGGGSAGPGPVESDGIMVLPPKTRVGKPIARVFDKTDAVLEISVTPNRPDVLSHLGLARELSALFRLDPPKLAVKLREAKAEASGKAKVDVRAKNRCPRYLARVIEGVKVGPSPDWVVKRLEKLGLRSISNVVDATNLALLELGHPLHAFDLDKLRGRKIVVRRAKDGETLKTIDDVERKLDEDDLVIADAELPVALAGVMGGAESEVGEGTTDVLLESALFEPGTVRRSARRHALHTEASHRFERGADPLALERAIDRCAELIVELAGGTVLAGRVEATKREYSPKVAWIRPERASRVLGRAVDKKEIRATLTALGLTKLKPDAAGPRPKKKGDALAFRIPSWRVDLSREEDLIEEVARLAGFDSIPTIMPSLPSEPWDAAPPRDDAALVRAALVGEGFLEAISLAFASPARQEALGLDVSRAVRLANPLGEESAAMRMSMWPALLEAAVSNGALLRTDLALFEIGRSFEWANPPGELPIERARLGILMRGARAPRSWAEKPGALDVFDLKGVVERLLGAFAVPEVRWAPFAAPALHPRSATRIELGEVVLGTLGELHPDVADRYGLEGPPVYLAELELEALFAARGARPSFAPLPRFPAVGRDLSFFIDRGIGADRILAAARGAGAAHLEEASIFDVYEGDKLPKERRSVAISLVFRAAERTLVDAEVDADQAKIMAALSALGAELRTGA